MGRRILIVDDDKAIRFTVEYMLAAAGYEIASAPDGEEAMRLIKEFGPDLVITDLVMPKMDGLEMIAQLKGCRPDVVVVAMSGGARLDNTNVLEAAQSAGADYVIAKPFDASDLYRVVGHSLGMASHVS